jgi:prepilin-type N-terminal cleavage/methylation domain-containing protein
MRIFRAGAYNDHGFTMIELAMVLLVIGIVGAIIMPRVGGVLDRQQMRQTINKLRGMVRYLQARAALTKRVYRLTFDLDRQLISVCYLIDDGCQPEYTREMRDYSLPQTVYIQDVVNPQGDTIREGEAVTHFHPTGLAEPSTIHLGSSSDQQFTLMIEPLAGGVKVFNGYVEPGAG